MSGLFNSNNPPPISTHGQDDPTPSEETTMSLLSRVTKFLTNWRHTSSLPNEPDATAVPQSWHHFNHDQTTWLPITPSEPSVSSAANNNNAAESEATNRGNPPLLTLLTWNVDALANHPEPRILGILSTVRTQSPQPDILFFQEVSKPALASLLSHPWIRSHWYSSESDVTHWLGQQFAAITLLSRRTFSHIHRDDIPNHRLGQIWRVRYPSRFARDALCCDIFIRPLNTRVRLVNVHLDSLPIQPSLRTRQLAIVANMLHAAGRGVVAGDFNPVLPGDDELVQANRLADVWTELQGTEGFTWGIDGKQPFPPGRLDKIAMVGLEAKTIDVIHPGVLSNTDKVDESQDGKDELISTVPWSDHSGLKCSFGLVDVQ